MWTIKKFKTNEAKNGGFNTAMNAKQLSERINTEANLTACGLLVRVRILDAKTAYGNVRFLVTPVTGSETVWVDQSRLTECA